MTREQEFLAQLPVIDRMIGWVCARRGLRAADAEDFASIVKMRLIENDYEILARFEGRSSLKTYLAVVVNRLYLDFQAQRFGKWRPSAEARRLGPVALRLERLLQRDRLTFDEACGVLLSDTSVSESRDELYAISLRLPRRPGRSSGDDAVEPATLDADAAERQERQALADRTFAVIRHALACLPPQDRLFLRLHFDSGLTVAQVSRALATGQKSLYRRKEELLKLLRRALAAEGIGSRDAQELLSSLDWDAGLGAATEEFSARREQSGSGPSSETDGPPKAGEP
jgi:RNA polymerase sigma factor for flagellar operon FliA